MRTKEQRPKLSVLIVAKNEEKKLPECLKSVRWVDEVIVVDNQSSDKTAGIAQRFGAKVFEYRDGDFSTRKNFASSKAGGRWLFFLDADERVTLKLRKKIKKIVFNKESNSTYAIPRRNVIFGKEMKHCGLWPDYVIRLFKKNNFRRWEAKLHEQPIYDGKLVHLNEPLLHLKHDNLTDMVTKTNEWSEVEASLMYLDNHPRMNFLRFLSVMFREFWLRMVRQTAFLDGSKGVIYALYQMWSRFISYAKLWEMQLNEDR